MSAIDGLHQAEGGAPETQKKAPNVDLPTPEMEAQHRLENALSDLAQAPNIDDGEETPSELPTAAEQLETIVAYGSLVHRLSSSAEKTVAWNAYVACINEFRKTYANLPPVDDINTSSLRYGISDALQRGDAATVVKLFDEERAELAKPSLWKRLPFVNFFVGVGDSGAELVESFSEMRIREVPNNLVTAFQHIDDVGKMLARVDEYEESINKHSGETVGYVIGKSVGDLASAILTGGIGGAAAKAAQAAKAAKVVVGVGHKLERVVHVGGHVAGHAAAEVAHITGHGAHGEDHKLEEPPVAQVENATKRTEPNGGTT